MHLKLNNLAKRLGIIAGLIILFSAAFDSFAEEKYGRYIKPEDPLVLKKLDQWQDYKFGLMMHWGPYSQWGVVESWSICSEDEGWCYQGENYEKYKQDYEKLPLTFNPVDFDPVKWAKAAKHAGMRYLVFTTKHHDGFCMFDTKTTEYKITGKDSPFRVHQKADVTKGIFDAFRAENMMIGAYFSKPDWHSEYFWWPKFATPDRNVNYSIEKHPDRWKKFVEYTHTQIDELCSNYGPVDLLWFDGGWVQTLKPEDQIFSGTVDALYRERGYTQLRIPQNQDLKMDDLVANARRKQPGLIVVDRAVEGSNQNYFTPEQTIPSSFIPFPWETCLTMGGSWSFYPQEKYKPARQLIHTLVDVASKGGNLLLNIGPGPDGKWHEEAYVRLNEIGDWMAVNHSAIYETRGNEKFAEGNIRFTFGKSGRVNAIYLAEDGETKMPKELVIATYQPKAGTKVKLLGYDKALTWKKVGNFAVISIPSEMQKKAPCQFAWTFSFEADKNL
jgi:alpha-L-fucosidase